jgi:hypothetical protein
MKETNRSLKAPVAGKSPEHLPTVFKPQNESRGFKENKQNFELYNERKLKQLTLDHIPGGKATEFREDFLSLVNKSGYLDDKVAGEEPYRGLVIYRSEIVTEGGQEVSLLARRH